MRLSVRLTDRTQGVAMQISVDTQGIEDFLAKNGDTNRDDYDYRTPMTVVTPAHVFARKLVQAATTAITQLGALSVYIESVELFFAPEHLRKSFSPRFKLTVTIPRTTQTLTVFGPSTSKCYALPYASDPFPGLDFIQVMVGDVRRELHREIEMLRANLDLLDEPLASPKQDIAV